MAGANTGKHRSPRIALGVSDSRVGPRSHFVPVCRDGRAAGPASAGRDDAARARIGDGAAAVALDRGRIRRDGHERGASVLCDSGEDLPEYLLSGDRKSTRLNSSHPSISYAVFCLKKKKKIKNTKSSNHKI